MLGAPAHGRCGPARCRPRLRPGRRSSLPVSWAITASVLIWSGKRRRHIADLEAARFLMPAQQPLIGRASGIGLDGELGNDIGGHLILLRETQEPVDRDRVPRSDAGDGFGSRQPYVYVRQKLGQGRAVEPRPRSKLRARQARPLDQSQPAAGGRSRRCPASALFTIVTKGARMCIKINILCA